MSYGNDKADVAHAFTAHFLLGHHNTTTVAHNPLVTDTLVLSAMAFIVLYRTEYLLAEQTVAFGLIGAVIDGFRLGYLSA